MARTIQIKHAGRWVEKLKGEFHEAAQAGIQSAAIRIVNRITTEIIPKEDRIPVDRGAYRAGWMAKKIPEGALIYNSLPYASIIEWGARAENIKVGRKMIDAITAWVKRKGFTSSAPTTKSGKPRKVGEDEARQIAWAIATAMTRTGIFNRGKGLRILEKALDGVHNIVREEIEREIEKIAEGAD